MPSSPLRKSLRYKYISIIFICISAQLNTLANNNDTNKLWDIAITTYNNAKVAISAKHSKELYTESLVLFEQLLETGDINDNQRNDILTYIINCKAQLIKRYSTNSSRSDILKHLNNLIATSKDSTTYIRNLLFASQVCTQFEDINQAIILYNEAKDRYLKYKIDDREMDIIFLETLGEIEFNNNREYTGLRHFTSACKISRNLYGAESQEYLLSLLNLSKKYSSVGRFVKSSYLHTRAHKPYIESVRKQFGQSSEQKRAEYWGSAHQYFAKTYEIALEFVKGLIPNNSISSTAYDCNLLSKSILLTTSNDFDVYVKAQTDSIIAKLAAQKEKQSGAVADSTNNLIIERLSELDLSYTSPHLDITWKDVKKGLKADDLAIEFFKVNSTYGALLLKKHWRQPKCILLGDLSLDIQSSYMTAQERWSLSKAIWTDDILRHFPRREDAIVYFSPDAEMHLFGIEYLPLFEENAENLHNSISDYFNIHRLSSTRKLTSQNSTTGTSEYTASLYGAADFTLSQNKINKINFDFEKNRKGSSDFRDYDYENILKQGIIADGAIPALPNTLHEIDRIQEHMESRSIIPVIATGGYFNEYIFRHTCSDKNIIHIATHGFYLPDTSSENGIYFSPDPMDRNALIVSGGASTIWFTHNFNNNDGVITANEIARLDLTKSRLVVMSSCESGVGVLDTDGVFGLQRGFKKAGAESIIMSLWEVDDEACYILFDKFYQNLIINNMSVRDAFTDAQRHLRKDPRFESMNHWASFILID